jgi:hypothetical protein
MNRVTTLTNGVGYGGIALALMIAFLCRRAANNNSIPSFDMGNYTTTLSYHIKSLLIHFWLFVHRSCLVDCSYVITDYSPLQLPEELLQLLTVTY